MANIDRIRKLLEKYESGKGHADARTATEAESARSIAEGMMAAAGLTEADVIAAGAAGEPAPETTVGMTGVVKGRRRPPAWQRTIFAAVGRITGCFLYTWTGEDDIEYRIIGTLDARTRFVTLCDWAFGQIETLAKGAQRIYADKPDVRSYMFAYRAGLAEAIAAQSRRLVEVRSAAPASSTALATRSAVEAAIDRFKPAGLKPNKVRATSVLAGAFAAGKSAGEGIALQPRAAAPAGQRALGGG